MSKRKTTEEFIEQARRVHDDRFDYSKVEYTNAKTKICIICRECGAEFWQLPNNHLKQVYCCPKCSYGKGGKSNLLTTTEFIEKAKLIHKDNYDYSKVQYIDYYTPITIICKKHGEFQQKPEVHLKGSGCQKCQQEKKRNCRLLTTQEFLHRAKEIHDTESYNYENVEYKDIRTPICIICPEHGEFWQKPYNHLRGCGCPKCKSSKLEKNIRSVCHKNSIFVEEQKTFEWLIFEKHMYLDFYLPYYNIAIECQGEQHFFPRHNYNETIFKKIQERDACKKKLCEEHGIKILYFSNLGIEYPYEVFENETKLIEEILKTKINE